MFCMFLLVFVFSQKNNSWDTANHVTDRYDLIHTVDLKISDDNSIVGALDQILLLKGNVIIVDSSTKQIKRFSLSGEFLGLIGNKGKGPGEYDQPNTIVTSENGDIYVYDRSSAKITVFDSGYIYQRSFNITHPKVNGVIFPRGIFEKSSRLFARMSNHSKSPLVEISKNGEIRQFLLHADEKLPEVFLSPKISIIGNKIWVGRSTHSTCRIWDINSMMSKPKTLTILGYPNMIDEAKFDFDKGTYDGISLRKRWFAKVNRIWSITNLGDQFAMIGPFFFNWPDPDAPLQEPETSAEEARKSREKATPYFNVYDKDGVLVRAQLPLIENRWPLEPVFILSSYDSRYLFFYAWREETEQNPLIRVYRFKGVG